jgi:hypothetical protein
LRSPLPAGPSFRPQREKFPSAKLTADSGNAEKPILNSHHAAIKAGQAKKDFFAKSAKASSSAAKGVNVQGREPLPPVVQTARNALSRPVPALPAPALPAPQAMSSKCKNDDASDDDVSSDPSSLEHPKRRMPAPKQSLTSLSASAPPLSSTISGKRKNDDTGDENADPDSSSAEEPNKQKALLKRRRLKKGGASECRFCSPFVYTAYSPLAVLIDLRLWIYPGML